jgi:hypothetical protein
VVDLAGVNKVIPLAPANVQAVPLVAVQREPGDGQRLAPRAGLLHPVVAAPAGVAAVADFGNHALQPQLARVREHILTLDLEALAKLDFGVGDGLLEFCLPLVKRKFPEVAAV